MGSNNTRTLSARSKYPTQLAKMSFDEILDLTADVLSFYNTIPGTLLPDLIPSEPGPDLAPCARSQKLNHLSAGAAGRRPRARSWNLHYNPPY